jgi:hypothetical protein
MKTLLAIVFLVSTGAFADEIKIQPGQSIEVGDSTVVTCADKKSELDFVCYLKKYACCEYAPYIVNMQSMERSAIGNYSTGKANALNVIKQYVAAGKCSSLDL